LGQTFDRTFGMTRYQVVGLVRDAPYRNLREAMLPSVYVPLQPMRTASFLVRTSSANPLALASSLRREVPVARPELRVSNIRTQEELVRAQTIRERLLAMLGLFFAGVALLLAGVGLAGVLDYSVVQRRREIGIRLAIGAPSGEIARRVGGRAFAMVLGGGAAGLGMSMASVRFIDTLFYEVKATDPAMLALPWMAMLAAASLAAAPAVIRATRIDPVTALRAE